MNRFGARFAYTLDGPKLGELEIENFSADAMTIAFKGFNAHPGYAKGRMVSAIKLASEFVHRLPRNGLSPETTDGYDGYVHPHAVQGGVERAVVKSCCALHFERASTTKLECCRLAEESCGPFPQPPRD